MTIKLSGQNTTGLSNIKGVRTRDSDGAFWSTVGVAFEAYNSANIANYGIMAAETGATGIYTFTDPADTTPGRFRLVAAAVASLVVSDLAANVFWEDAAGPQKANMEQLAGVIAPVTNLNTIFNTDYASVYDATNKAFLSKLGNFAMGGSSLIITYGAAQVIPRVTLVDTTTTNTDMRGTDNAALAATALSNVQWTNARAGYLDNLNVGGPVASHADVLAINQSASKHLLITTVSQYERPESGSTTYTVEVRTFAAGTGAAVNADSTPTVSPVGAVSGDLSANLGAGSNPATGVYRYVYTVSSNATQEQIRFDVSTTISAATFTLSCYTQVVDMVAATWTSTDAANLTAVFNKLPANNLADETLVLAAIAGVQSDTDNIQTRIPAALTADGNMKADALKIGGAAPNNLAASDVGAQIEIILFTTPRTLPGQVEPSTTPTLGGAIMDIFQEATAPYEQDANEQRQYDRTHTTVLRKRVVSYVASPTATLTFLKFTVGP